MKKTTLLLTLSFFALVPTFSFAEEATSTTLKGEKMETVITSSSTIATSTPDIKPFTVCSQEAIEKRDTDIAASRLTYNTAMANALTVRKNKEKLAVALKNADDKKDALKLSVETYKSQTKAAQNSLTQARKLVWQTFEDDIKLCRDIEDKVLKAKEESVSATSTTEVGMRLERSMKADVEEVKTFKEVIKEQFETLRSLFN